MGGDNGITVDISGTKMVVNPVYANDERVLGILYQHAHTERQCMFQGRGVDLTQDDVSYPNLICDACPIPSNFHVVASYIVNNKLIMVRPLQI